MVSFLHELLQCVSSSHTVEEYVLFLFVNFNLFIFDLNIRFLRERGMVHPQNGIPGFFVHFLIELSYGYHRFEGNGKIPLGRQGKKSALLAVSVQQN